MSHPPLASLQAFVQGQLDETALHEVEVHLTDCPECQVQLGQLDHEADAFVDKLIVAAKSGTLPAVNAPPAARRASETFLFLSPSIRPRGASSEPGLPTDIGDYEILTEIGRGGMGVVYRARHRRLKRIVALKMVLQGIYGDPLQRMRFQIEAEMVARLQHPNIVQIHEVGLHEGRPFLALEYVDGVSLADHLTTARFTPTAAAELVERLASAMHHAHLQGVVHRDLKPANILIADCGLRTADSKDQEAQSTIRNPQSAIPKITDFGLAKRLDATSNLTQTGTIVGTPSYMAPEQARSGQQVGPAADTYALGAILYELLAGRPPFQATTAMDTLMQVVQQEVQPPSRINSHIPRDLETICLKCLHKEPRQRYASAEALAEDLRRFRHGESIQARPAGMLERTGRWARRRPALASSLLVICLMGLVGLPTVTALWWDAVAARQQAQDREGDAITARNEATAARNAAQLQSAQMLYTRGAELADQGKIGEGLHFMVEGLRAAPEDARAFQQVVRRSLAAWSPRLHSLKQILAHDDEVFAMVLSPDGRQLITGARNGLLQRWDLGSGEPLGAAVRMPDQVWTLAWSPDDRIIFVGGDRGLARFCDSRTLAGQAPSLKDQATIWSAAFSPDAQVLLTGGTSPGGQGGAIRLWDAVTGAALGDPISQPQTIMAVAWSPDGKQFLTGTGDFVEKDAPGVAQVWDFATRKPVGNPLIQGQALFTVGYSPDGQTLFTAGWDRTVRFWHSATQELKGRPLVHADAVTALAWHPDGDRVVTGCRDRRCRFWDLPSGRPLDSGLRHDGCAVGLTRNGRTLITCGAGERTVRAWDVAQNLAHPPGDGGASLPEPTFGLMPPTKAGGFFSPDGRTLATHSPDGIVRLWDTSTGLPIGVPLSHLHPWIRTMAFSADGKRLATSCQPQVIAAAVRVWDARTGAPLTPWMDHAHRVAALAFSPDGAILAAGDYSRKVVLWDSRTGDPVGPPLPQHDIVLSLAFHPEGKLLAVGTAFDYSRSPEVRVWDITTGQQVGPSLVHQHYVTFLHFDKIGKTLAAGTQDTLFRLWDLGAGAVRGAPWTHGRIWTKATLSPDESLWATGDGEGTVRLWSGHTGQPRAGGRLVNAGTTVMCLAFSPDARTLAVGHDDYSLRLWDVGTHLPLGPSLTHRARVLAVGFSPEGKAVVSVPALSRPQLWPLPEPLTATPEALANELRVRSALEFDTGLAVSQLTPESWRRQRDQLPAGTAWPR